MLIRLQCPACCGGDIMPIDEWVALVRSWAFRGRDYPCPYGCGSSVMDILGFWDDEGVSAVGVFYD